MKSSQTEAIYFSLHLPNSEELRTVREHGVLTAVLKWFLTLIPQGFS